MEMLATAAGTHDDALADLAQVILNVAREIRFRGYQNDQAVGLNPSDANVMTYVDGHPGATPSEVALATGLQRSNLSTALKNLESRGFVERRTDPADGRGVNLFPTPRAAQNLRLVRTEWAQQLARALGDDRENLDLATDLLNRLEAGLVAGRQR